MIIDDLREQLVERSTQFWGQIQESSTYTNFKEKYDSLSPTGQKSALLASLVFIILLIFSVPMTYYSSASSNIKDFESKKNLIRDLFRLQHATSELPPLAPGVSSGDLLALAKQKLENARLQPEQIKSVQNYDRPLAGISKSIIQNAIEVRLQKLNLTQIKDIGIDLQTLPNVKMLALEVEANSSASHYFNVIYRLSNFSLPAEPTPAPAKAGSKKK